MYHNAYHPWHQVSSMSIRTLHPLAMVHRHGERGLPLQTSIKVLEFTSSPGLRQAHSSSAVIINKTYDYHRCMLSIHSCIHLEKSLSEHALLPQLTCRSKSIHIWSSFNSQIPFCSTKDSDNIIMNIFRKLNRQGHNCLVLSAARRITGDACIPWFIAHKVAKNLRNNK